jgi:N4-gp56 family major capsid protein
MVSQFWSTKALKQLYPSLVMVELVKNSSENAYLTIPARKGQKVNFWRDPVLAASYTTINESADDPTAISYQMSAVSAQVSMYMRHAVISDLSESIGLKSAIDRIARGLTYGAFRTFNGIVGGAVSAGGTTYYCGDATSAADLTATDILSKAELEVLQMKLHANNVPVYPDGNYKMICHPVAIHELRADTGTNNFWDIVKYISLHEEQKRDFQVGKIAGFMLYESTEVVNTSAISGTGYGYYNLWSGYEGVGCVSIGGQYTDRPPKETLPNLVKKSKFEPSKSNFIIKVKLPGSAGTADPGDRRASVAYKMYTAAKVLNSTCCGNLLSGSARASTGA